jgi:hypothetical protein
MPSKGKSQVRVGTGSPASSSAAPIIAPLTQRHKKSAWSKQVEKDINLENMMTQLAMATATASDL